MSSIYLNSGIFPKNYHAYMVDYWNDKIESVENRILKKLGRFDFVHGYAIPKKFIAQKFDLLGRNYSRSSSADGRIDKAYQSLKRESAEIRKEQRDLSEVLIPAMERIVDSIEEGEELVRDIKEYCKLRDHAQKKAAIEVKQIFSKALRYTVAQIGLCFLLPIVWILDVIKWCSKSSIQAPERKIKKDLKLFVKVEDHKKIISYLYKVKHKLQPPKAEAMKKFLSDLLAIKETHRHLHHILKGANVIFLDKGRHFHRWKKLKGAYQRISSHDHERGNCYGLRSKIFHESLFWLDRDGNTRLQLEKTPFSKPILDIGNKLRHLVDFLRYFRDGLQQGPYGVSNRTESNPIVIRSSKHF